MNEIEKALFLPIETSPEQSIEAPAPSQTETPEPTDSDPDDPVERVEEAYENLNAVLETAVEYLLVRQHAGKRFPVVALSVREKIMLVTDLLPSAEHDYMVRFGVDLAHALWADCERSRILSAGRMQNGNWVEELNLLADWIVSAAFGLEESMGIEHADFKGPFRFGEPPED
jgi:hypothetical protein